MAARVDTEEDAADEPAAAPEEPEEDAEDAAAERERARA